MKYQHPRYLFRKFLIIRKIEPQDTFLEIGPGNLDLALDVIKRFNHGTLIDFNSSETNDIYDNLPSSTQEKLTLITADFMEYEQIDRKFDCIISCDVMEHIEDDEKFIHKIHSLLLDQGQLILSVPARKKYWGFDDELVGHYRRYEKEDLEQKLKHSGFSKINISSYGFPFTNFIRFLRILFLKNMYQRESFDTKIKSSKKSAFLIDRESGYKFLAGFINKYTLFPFILFSLLFVNLDLGEGYVITAEKA